MAARVRPRQHDQGHVAPRPHQAPEEALERQRETANPMHARTHIRCGVRIFLLFSLSLCFIFFSPKFYFLLCCLLVELPAALLCKDGREVKIKNF